MRDLIRSFLERYRGFYFVSRAACRATWGSALLQTAQLVFLLFIAPDLGAVP